MTHYNYVPPNNWTAVRIALLNKLVGDGLSAGQIAEELGGITRNAVIGKARRLGIGFCATNPGGRPKSGRKPRAHPFVERKVKHTHFPPAPAVDLPLEPVANPVTLMQLTDETCRWPVAGDGATTMFCGAMPACGHAYCAGHCRMAYTRPMTPAERELAMRKIRRMKAA